MTQNEQVLRHLLDNKKNHEFGSGRTVRDYAVRGADIRPEKARLFDKDVSAGREISERRKHGICGISAGAGRRSAEEMEVIIMILEIGNTDDRRIVAGILVSNGYTVREIKVPKGKTKRIALEAVPQATGEVKKAGEQA